MLQHFSPTVFTPRLKFFVLCACLRQKKTARIPILMMQRYFSTEPSRWPARETINECFVFQRLSSCKSQCDEALVFYLDLVGASITLQINIQKPLIKNPPPRPPLEQDKQIWGCVCSLLAHPILYFNDFTSTSEKKMQDGTMQQNMTQKDEDKTQLGVSEERSGGG